MSDANNTNTKTNTNTNNKFNNEVNNEVKHDVQTYTRFRPSNIKIENSRWNLDSNHNTSAGDMTALPLSIPVLKRSEPAIISNDSYIDSDIESDF